MGNASASCVLRLVQVRWWAPTGSLQIDGTKLLSEESRKPIRVGKGRPGSGQ